MRRIIFTAASMVFWIMLAANAGELMPWDPSLARSFTYKDPRTAITFYVESDGKHVAAIDAAGKLLWVRSPFKDPDPAETRTPVIDGIEAAESPVPKYAQFLQRLGFKADRPYIRITSALRSFGIMDERTGDFILEGQN
jgi:hypothetical protein